MGKTVTLRPQANQSGSAVVSRSGLSETWWHFASLVMKGNQTGTTSLPVPWLHDAPSSRKWKTLIFSGFKRLTPMKTWRARLAANAQSNFSDLKRCERCEILYISSLLFPAICQTIPLYQKLNLVWKALHGLCGSFGPNFQWAWQGNQTWLVTSYDFDGNMCFQFRFKHPRTWWWTNVVQLVAKVSGPGW